MSSGTIDSSPRLTYSTSSRKTKSMSEEQDDWEEVISQTAEILAD